MSEGIPNYDLKVASEEKQFSIKTMESIWDLFSGEPNKPHRHNYYTVLWVKKASGIHRVDFRNYPLKNQTLHFVSPGQIHQIIPSSRPEGIAILFTLEFLQNQGIDPSFISRLHLFSDCDETHPVSIPSFRQSYFNSLATDMLLACQKEDEWVSSEVGAYLKLVLIACNRLTESHNQALGINKIPGSALIQAFKQKVEQHYQVQHKVSDYADHLFVTANHLNDVVKSKIGKSAKEYIQNRLILEAKRQAVFTRLTSKEIGFALGFEDPAYFSKFFKKHTGKNFQEFRETERKDI